MSRSLDRCSTLERGSPETEPRSCGTQSAYESLFNRRLRVLSPAVRTNDRRSPRRRSEKLARRPLKANMRAVCFSNRPFGVKRFQTIHHHSVDVARGLVLLSGISTRLFHNG